MGEIGTNLLLQRIAEQAREQRMIRDAALENKFRKLPNPTSHRNDKLVHNLSSKELTKDQMQSDGGNGGDQEPHPTPSVVGLLKDRQFYVPCATNPVKALTREINAALLALENSGAITPTDRRMARPQDTALARFYGLPEVHKDGAPLRPIVSLKGTPTYGLAKWPFRRLKFLTAESDTTVSSSAEFLEKLKGDLAIETIELLLQSKYDETENRLGHAQILQLLKFCLRTYFTFNGTIYDQVKCTPMGSPISGFIAEAVLQRLESLVFQHHKPTF
nr:unnamed protein product [Spirometra erinaceieuropaei]